VHLRRAGSAAVLAVTDDGPGIDPDFLPVAADRFARSDLARSRPGAGLGLSLVRSLVEQAGGELRLCSRGVHHRCGTAVDVPCAHPEVGTTASVLLPLHRTFTSGP
jgi:signal transduction histidine kinase